MFKSDHNLFTILFLAYELFYTSQDQLCHNFFYDRDFITKDHSRLDVATFVRIRVVNVSIATKIAFYEACKKIK